MIILDEQLQNPDIITAVEKWYPGTVTHIRRLRPKSVIKDDNIATLLHAAQKPIFVTINVDDFWRKFQAHPNYCIIAIDLARRVRKKYLRYYDKFSTTLLSKLVRYGWAKLSMSAKVQFATTNRMVKFMISTYN